MLISHEREKLVNAILFFAHATKHLGKIKLFKLLYLLDFEHFRQTGRSVTGLDYQAWKFGPVPVEVMQEWDAPEPDLEAAISHRARAGDRLRPGDRGPAGPLRRQPFHEA